MLLVLEVLGGRMFISARPHPDIIPVGDFSGISKLGLIHIPTTIEWIRVYLRLPVLRLLAIFDWRCS
jgi:hypothetical protein